MIKLETAYYCNDCPYFEPETIKLWADGDCHTIVKCENADKCADLYKRFTAIDRAASINPDDFGECESCRI